MSDERLDRLEKMMEQLIQMVGHNNAVTEELRQRIDKLETKVDTFETKMQDGFTSLDTKLEKYGQVQQQDVYHLLELIDKKLDKTATKEDITQIADTQTLHSEMLRKLAADTAQHEAEITLLKRAK